MTVGETFQTYGVLMRQTLHEFKTTGRKNGNFRPTVRWIMDQVWGIDPNPRAATLEVFLEYNAPDLLDYAEVIWNQCHTNL